MQALPTWLLLIKPVKHVVLGKDRAVLRATSRIRRLLSVEAVESGLLVLAPVAQAEEDIAGAVVRHGRYLDAPKDVCSVSRRANSHLVEVVDREAGQVLVAQVSLNHIRVSGWYTSLLCFRASWHFHLPLPGSTLSHVLHKNGNR